jgi:hypothetical protein
MSSLALFLAAFIRRVQVCVARSFPVPLLPVPSPALVPCAFTHLVQLRRRL